MMRYRRWRKWLWCALAAGSLAATARAETKTMVSILNGAQASSGSPASGCARVQIDTVANTLDYRIDYSGLSGAETAAHFHGPAPIGVAAGVLQGLPAGSPKVGTWNYPEAQEANILGGLVYINIHSTTDPGGEIRGQLVDMVAVINGAQESPAVTLPGAGYGLFSIDTCANTLSYFIDYTGLSGPETAAHIHGFSLHGVNAGVLHGLPAGNPKVGAWTYSSAQEPRILAGQTYVNIHTAANPGGEIRGQITAHVVPIDGQQEVGPVASPGHGCGFLAHNPAGDALSYFISYQSLSGPVTAAHIHGFAPPGVNAGVQHGIGTANPALGTWSYPAGDEANIVDGLTYINVHTAANPGGEIRGQVLFPQPPCSGDTNCDGTVNVQDLVQVILDWGCTNPPMLCLGDVNNDGVVNVQDLVTVILGWGGCP